MTAPDSLMTEATDRARRAGISPEVMAMGLRMERKDRPFVVELEDKTAGGPFFRITQEGPTRVLYLNLGHPFYDTIYDPPGATPQYRAAIEILLWTLGASELDAETEELRTFWARERGQWSRDLGAAAPILDQMLGFPDERAMLADADEEDEVDETPPET